MYALVKKGQVTNVIKSPLNFKLADGSVVADVRFLSREKRIENGIYDYYQDAPPNMFETSLGMNFVVDEKAGTVKQDYQKQPIALEDALKIKEDMLHKEAISLLEKTDRDVLVALEKGVPVSKEIQEERAAIRAKLDTSVVATKKMTAVSDIQNHIVEWLPGDGIAVGTKDYVKSV